MQTLLGTEGNAQVCQDVVETLIMCKLNVSEGVFCAPAQCVEEVSALVPAFSEGQVAIHMGCLSVCTGEENNIIY